MVGQLSDLQGIPQIVVASGVLGTLSHELEKIKTTLPGPSTSVSVQMLFETDRTPQKLINFNHIKTYTPKAMSEGVPVKSLVGVSWFVGQVWVIS